MAAAKSVSFNDLRQEVRRFAPSDLLGALASISAAAAAAPFDTEQHMIVPPWGIAVIARESVLYGNEHRSATVDEASLRRLFNMFSNIYEGAAPDKMMSIHATFTRLAYEQFPYQESEVQELGRTLAVLTVPSPAVETEVVTPAIWEELIGAPLPVAVAITTTIFMLARASIGRFDPSVFDRPDMSDLRESWTADAIQSTIERLVGTTADMRSEYAEVPPPPEGYERFAYNPLARKPLLAIPNGETVAPQVRLIPRTLSLNSLYYAAIARFEEPFARDLGHLVEAYIGRQLGSMSGVETLGEISYGKKDGSKSVDWIVIFPELVLLVECKSARLGLLDKTGGESLPGALARVFDKAFPQLGRTDALIREGHPKFAQIPNDRPRVGVVVTAEPYYLANSPDVRDLLKPAPISTFVMSLRDLEDFVTLPASDAANQMLSVVQDPERSTSNFATAFTFAPDHDMQNPILAAAWESCPWPQD